VGTGVADNYGVSPDRTTVLVVDDEAPVRELLRRWLEAWGYRVRQAGDATDALVVMLAEPSSIMLVDIRMPGRDGLWLIERIKENWPKTVFIVASAADDFETVKSSQRAGAVDYVLKPFARVLLRQALDRAETARGWALEVEGGVPTHSGTRSMAG
jgi:YesN/AraC family two-component response regulator